ncbi:hypothetical protein BP5796_01849 [Coleophoma crateriformis]|uniref:Uncharacterized protein n=1 Tax=Coleophoma crateriformis TaxID=565419 RepID=A0A3D8T1K5_9HELO|nr:hypothetical protein BP5796_01849 [Coleophoma crateriformis]
MRCSFDYDSHNGNVVVVSVVSGSQPSRSGCEDVFSNGPKAEQHDSIARRVIRLACSAVEHSATEEAWSASSHDVADSIVKLLEVAVLGADHQGIYYGCTERSNRAMKGVMLRREGLPGRQTPWWSFVMDAGRLAGERALGKTGDAEGPGRHGDDGGERW